VGVLSTDNLGGLPSGVVHRLREDDGFGRPMGTVCGLSNAGMYLFLEVDFAHVAPHWRCPACCAPPP
jgi:hypothetical protein